MMYINGSILQQKQKVRNTIRIPLADKEKKKKISCTCYQIVLVLRAELLGFGICKMLREQLSITSHTHRLAFEHYHFYWSEDFVVVSLLSNQL